VAVSWAGAAAGARFGVAIDTHSVDLDTVDITRQAILCTAAGDVSRTSWAALKGGHHRSGELAFPDVLADGQPAIGTSPVEVVIRDVGGIPERTFTTATLSAVVGGMTCGACVRRVEQALSSVAGTRAVHADLATGEVAVEHDGTASFHKLRAAVEDAGYTLHATGVAHQQIERVRALILRPLVVGPAASFTLLVLYLGPIALAQGWEHTLQQFEHDRPFVLALAAGFGLQAGLYTRLRSCHVSAARGDASMAASSGTSAAAMLACCAHHLTDILPVLGVSGVAVFLGTYQTPLLWLGLLINLAGVAYLTWQLRRRTAVPSAATSPPSEFSHAQAHA
jgi:copper chaperone CopZ